MGAWPYPPWLVSCNERSVFVPEWTTPQLSSMCLTLSPMVSLMYKAKCIHPRVNNSPKFMVVCYSVVWYCMVGDGMVWVLTIDGCSLQMGAKPYHTITYPWAGSIFFGVLVTRALQKYRTRMVHSGSESIRQESASRGGGGQLPIANHSREPDQSYLNCVSHQKPQFLNLSKGWGTLG